LFIKEKLRLLYITFLLEKNVQDSSKRVQNCQTIFYILSDIYLFLL